MKAIGYFGKLEQVENTYENTEDGIRAGIVLEDEWENGFTNIPPLGDPNPYYPDLILDSVRRERQEAGLAKFTLTYISADGSIDWPEREYEAYTMEASCTDEPLLTHPKFENIDENTKAYLGSLMNGYNLWDKVPELGTSGPTGQEKSLKELLDGASGAAKEALRLILSGVRSYRCRGVIWMQNSRLRTISPPSAANCGKIASPSGPAPSSGNRNWLMSGMRAETHHSGKGWNVSVCWELSGQGKWDTYLYG